MKRVRPGRRPSPMDTVRMFSPATQIFGRLMAIPELLDRVKDFSWEESLIKLSILAAVATNGQGGLQGAAVRERTVAQLRQLRGTDRALLAEMAAYLDAAGDTVVLAHEEAVRLLQHVTLAYGGDAVLPSPAWSEVALWLAAVSDHLGQWAQPDSRALSQAEELIAIAAHALRFNNVPDWLREIVRACEILSSQPSRNKLADAAIWSQVQNEAFGTSFVDYAESFLVPFAMTARGWGILPTAEEPASPVVSASNLVAQLDAPESRVRGWLDDLTSERTAVRDRLVRSPPALPHAPIDLLHRPLVRGTDGALVASSPSAVLTQLKTGVWARMLNASKKILGAGGAEVWTSTFGDLFEAWCVRVATQAAASPWFRGDVIVPSAPGAADEIEDVVVREGRAFVLFSVKARLVTENVARRAPSRSALLDWYDDFFFGPATSTHRPGVLRQLSARIDLVRAGAFEPRVPRAARVLPVLVTYDSMCDDVLLHQRIEERCRANGLLLQAGVGPLTLARVDDFETLLAMAAHGESIVGILRKREHAWRHRRLDALLHAVGNSKPERLPMMTTTFDDWIQRALERLHRKRQRLSGGQ